MTKTDVNCRKTKIHSEGGFSLVELAIVMVIIGLLSAPLIQSYRIYIDTQHRENTKVNMTTVISALGNFYSMYGRYPCPSDRSIAFGQPGHGVEVCPPILTAIPPNGCSANNGVCRAQTFGQVVDVGGIPYATLGIPFSNTLDGWKAMMTYTVTEVLTDSTTFNTALGGVRILKVLGGNPANATDVDIVHAAIISSGDNGSGAFNVEGNARACTNGYAETENCDNDDVFISVLRSEVPGANYYDDMIRPADATESGIWTYTLANQNNVNSMNTGNVGIGTTTPTQKLEVVGNVKADNTYSTQFCDSNGANCFPASIIGGSGIACPSGQVLYGIANNSPLCKSVSVTPSTGQCGTGQYVTGIVNGQVQCATP